MRESFKLTSPERDRFNDLRSDQGEAFKFWKAIAAAHNLDYKSIISDERGSFTFTALPLDHDKHWCWPMELKCKRPAVAISL
jgi:hypothetical protein